ncbi:family 20 glycosylhydrolase [Mucilaginibacter sp. UYCu711]|uniref:family 20 glycosylhydrolase n=1 Tax=Mucilaginibacter sp. UYCu711 TaxID=3156339 RepID=UPI003D23FEBF
MKYLFSVLLAGLLFVNAFAQQKSNTNIDLHLKWEIIENNHQGQQQSLAALTLTTGKQFTLPAKGWKLYFNFLRPVIAGSVTGGLDITHINGDFHYLAPKARFNGIAKNSSLKAQLLTMYWLINKTDSPRGFYLVWDNAPNKFYPLSDPELIPSTQPKQFARSLNDNIAKTTPQFIYEQNKTIRDIPADSLIKIFPTPQSYRPTVDKFILTAGTKIVNDAAFNRESAYLKNELDKLLLPAKTLPGGSINLVKKQMPEEAYELSVTNTQVTISASSASGIFYGIQSLKTLIQPSAYGKKQATVLIPGVNVTDGPRFGYRAFMLDVARNFQPKKEILKLLDLMSLYKLNVFHFHLTDDEGWRLQIPALPELTTVGGKRGHTLDNSRNIQPSYGSGPFASNTTFYTKADFIEILKYAADRHITIIPEIETPGHARAALKAMDARYRNFISQNKPLQAQQYLLRDLSDSSKYTSVQYFNDNVIDVSLPSTYQFIETIVSEVKQMYIEAGTRLQTIHFGGDEVPAGVWEKSPAFFSLMKRDTTIKSSDDLWAYYYGRVNQILKANNLYLTAWEEVGTYKVMQNGKKATVINPALANVGIHLEVWNNVLGWGSEDLAYKLANSGYKVILSNVTNLYFDMAYNKSFQEPGYYWGSYADESASFSFIPYDYFKNVTVDRLGNVISAATLLNKEKLTDKGKQNIIGLQGALWGENLQNTGKLEYVLLPKLLGFAERAWAADPDWAIETKIVKSRELYQAAWSKFVNILGKRELPRLTYYAGGFQYRIPEVGIIKANKLVTANSGLPGFDIHYTTDGKKPVATSPVYTRPLSASKLKFGLINIAGRSGRVTTVENK